MSQNSNSVASEIDAIIARAMEEYRSAKGGVDAFADTTHPEPEPEEPNAHVEIPVNSESVLVSEETSRFSGAIWFDNIQHKQVILAGLGGIGSYVAFLLSRLHPESIYVYDDDIVESANMSGQLYSSNYIGAHKAYVTADLASSFSNYYNIVSVDGRFTQDTPGGKIMICGFDNMEARKTFYRVWKMFVAQLPEEEQAECLYIDGRLAAESFQVLCIKGDDHYNMNKYEDEFLFSDWEADETICSYKQTSFMANMIGSVMVNLFVNFCANQCNPLVSRDLPFYTEYSADTMYFKVVS